MWRNVAKRLETKNQLSLFRNCLKKTFCTSKEYDIAIIGAGIVGMATARELAQRFPDKRIVVLEKSSQVAQHQSKYNSGVIHAGIFYKPGSNKARLCVQGASLMYEYCKQHKIPHEKVGKLIVATNTEESEQLDNLYQRGVQNGVKDLELIDERRILQLEPFVRGKRALYSPHTGICNFELVTKSFEKDFLESRQNHIIKGFRVTSFHTNDSDAIEIRGMDTNENISSVYANNVICCAGLSADILAKVAGGHKYPVIIPFRGRYRLLKEEAKYLVKSNIYPVPDPKYPFLGVHFTPTVQGQITIGPSAALSLTKTPSVSSKNLKSILGEKALWNFISKNLSSSVSEVYYDTFQRAFVKRAQTLVPSLQWSHTTFGWQGVRAQAMAEDGSLVEDFVFESLGPKGRMLHVRNAPSPAATSSLAIAKTICDRAIRECFHL